MILITRFPLTLAIFIVIGVLISSTYLMIENYPSIFNLIYFAPGTIFTALVFLTKDILEKSLSNFILFLLIGTILYFIVFIISFTLNYIGICVLPSIGALIFIGMINYFKDNSISTKAILLSLLSGPVSGGITIAITIYYDEIGSIFFMPIILWWIFMAVLIDVATQKREKNV